MFTKLTLRRYFWTILLALAACAPAQTNATDVQSTAIVIFHTSVALTQAVPPTSTYLSPTFAPTATMVYPTPSPLPTNPPTIMITPDAIQVERWQEYQTELAKLVLSDSGVEFPGYEHALCEWVILGRSGQEVYVYAICTGPSTEGERPAVIYLEADGSIQDVDVVFPGSAWNSRIQELFPEEIQEVIASYYSYGYPGKQELYSHLTYRQTHQDVPPLIVLSAK